MPNNLIFHTATRIIQRLTTDDSPKMLPFESSIVVNDKFDFSKAPTSATGSWEILNDGVTLIEAPQQDIEVALDDYFPERAKKRNLLSKIDALTADQNASAKMKDLAAALKDYFGTKIPGSFIT